MEALKEQMCEKDRDGDDEAYIPEPFPEAKLQPDGWQDVLATVDVCVNEVTPTVFCDEEGYDLVPFHMVKLITHAAENMEKEAFQEGKERACKRRIRQNYYFNTRSSKHLPIDKCT